MTLTTSPLTTPRDRLDGIDEDTKPNREGNGLYEPP